MDRKYSELIYVGIAIFLLLTVVGIIFLATSLKTGAAATGMGSGSIEFIRSALMNVPDRYCASSPGWQEQYPELQERCKLMTNKDLCNTFMVRNTYVCAWKDIR